MTRWFERFSDTVSRLSGSPWAFNGTLGLIVLWGLAGPFCSFSDSWQLVANTSTTLVTTLMVFILQATQTRTTAALHLKMDALLEVSEANNRLIAVEERTAEEIAAEARELRLAVEKGLAPG